MSSPQHDAETERGLLDYIRQSQKVDDEIRKAIDELVELSTPLIVWGAGVHTTRLLAASRLAEANVRAFVDSNHRYQGKQLNGVPILAPTDLKGTTEAILISSRVFQQEIETRIKDDLKLNNRVIKLYDLSG